MVTFTASPAQPGLSGLSHLLEPYVLLPPPAAPETRAIHARYGFTNSLDSHVTGRRSVSLWIYRRSMVAYELASDLHYHSHCLHRARRWLLLPRRSGGHVQHFGGLAILCKSLFSRNNALETNLTSRLELALEVRSAAEFHEIPLRPRLGEYPAGSVSCAESTGELKGGTRNRWFILFTNSLIDWGFVIGAFVPYVVAAAAQNKYYGTIWRTSLGIGVVFPLVLFVLRLKLKEPEEFSRNSMKNARTPYGLVFKFYGLRLLVVSLIWFIYDVSNRPVTDLHDKQTYVVDSSLPMPLVYTLPLS